MGFGGRGSRALRPRRAILGVLSVPQIGVHSAWKRAEDAQRDARYDPACLALQRPSPGPLPRSLFGGFSGATLWPPGNARRINVLLCIVKGFALAQPLCCSIKLRVKKGNGLQLGCRWGLVSGAGRG